VKIAPTFLGMRHKPLVEAGFGSIMDTATTNGLSQKARQYYPLAIISDLKTQPITNINNSNMTTAHINLTLRPTTPPTPMPVIEVPKPDAVTLQHYLTA